MVYLDVEQAPFHLILAFSFAPDVLPSGDPYTSKMLTERLNLIRLVLLALSLSEISWSQLAANSRDRNIFFRLSPWERTDWNILLLLCYASILYADLLERIYQVKSYHLNIIPPWHRLSQIKLQNLIGTQNRRAHNQFQLDHHIPYLLHAKRNGLFLRPPWELFFHQCRLKSIFLPWIPLPKTSMLAAH